MATGDYILTKSNGTTYDEKAVGAVSGYVLGWDSSLNPAAVLPSFPGHTHAAIAITVSVINSNTNAQVNYAYIIAANLTLTLPASPTAGDLVIVSNMSGTVTPVIARNGLKIMGLSEDLTLDKLNAGIELRYSGSTYGWIIT